ncbi:MAG: TldD/PmbA family protein [Candidatus Nanoarchaeia archaeon]|nr:TldD/PmbA family protein [Candidatus Nanoarchaeia archaeon]
MNYEQLLKKYEPMCELVEYWESKSNKEIIVQQNKELKSYIKADSSGFSARMLVNGCFGFASSSNLAKKEEVFKTAFKLAKNASLIKKNKTIIKDFEFHKAKIKSEIKIDPFNIDESEKINFLKDFNNSFSLKELKNSETTISFSKNNQIYANSKFAEILQGSNYSQIFSDITAGNENVHNIRRAKKGYELFNFNYNEFVKESEDKIKRLMNSRLANPGRYNIVIDPEISGTFFHEAVGHALEADCVREKSTCIGLGEQVSTEELTLYDNPTLKDYWGSYSYDAEGIKSKQNMLINKGKIVNFMNDLSSYFDVNGLKKTSNARMQSVHNMPIPRMSNTEVKSGKYSKQELIEQIKNGLLVKGFSGGAVEPITGVFSFKADEAFLIKNGKIANSFKGASLSGDLKQVLKNITGISNEFGSPYSGGMCGKKGQSVPVSEKVPYIAVRDINVGN